MGATGEVSPCFERVGPKIQFRPSLEEILCRFTSIPEHAPNRRCVLERLLGAAAARVFAAVRRAKWSREIGAVPS